MLTSTAIQSFLDNRQAQNLRPASIVFYRNELKPLAAAYQELPEDPQAVESVLAAMIRAGQSMTSVRTRFTALHAFYNWASDRFNFTNPMAKVRAPRLTRMVKPTLEPDQVWRLISAAESSRDRAMFYLLADTGIRSGELVNLRKRDIYQNVILVRGKTGEREVPISDETRCQLLDLATDIGPDDYIFRGHKGTVTRHTVYATVRKYMLLCDIPAPKLGPHRLRHAFGKGYLVAGGDLRSLQEIMGHTNITTTQQYIAYSQGDLISKHHRFTLLRSAQAAAHQDELAPAGVIREAERILEDQTRR